MRKKASVDRVYPSLSGGLQMDSWVYDRPCVVAGFYRHPVNGRIVQVAPLTSRPRDESVLNNYLPLAPSSPINGFQLSLRGNRRLDRMAYVKKVRFEVDVRLLTLHNSARHDMPRLTKASIKVLLEELPAAIPWVPVPTPPVLISQGSAPAPVPALAPAPAPGTASTASGTSSTAPGTASTVPGTASIAPARLAMSVSTSSVGQDTPTLEPNHASSSRPDSSPSARCQQESTEIDESQPLLLDCFSHTQPHYTATTSSDIVNTPHHNLKESSHSKSMPQRTRPYLQTPLKLVLCIPMLLLLIPIVVLEALLAPVFSALLRLLGEFREVVTDGNAGLVVAWHRLGRVLVATLTSGEDPGVVVGPMKDEEYHGRCGSLL
ncbi:hypothetical protein EPUS_07308 [Endocarpon pusillum Z07020]|uniref:Uncharacterized protein n=1 Tax=Endocarpon pusillum (strain Z07020 / HMAS-L-300199) TaxID=1263415 RepID=U1GVC3_ENDPU|nr:uncharacterized protein EPUS_07308 [Endocarpon pusillum Z07020]ERF76428.1 hypothetical protein EPUS_07308 [Endocarpon pusillum Z07020]